MAKTIMFVHGAWVTPACWAYFRKVFESRGYACLTPAWPLMDRPAGELRAHPHPDLPAMTIRKLVDHHAALIGALPEQPILIGHSFGGLIVQMLLDRGLGAAGVAIDAGPPRGVLPSLRAIRSAFPVLLAWRGWQRVLRMSFSSFVHTFGNSLPASEQRTSYEQHIVPAPGRIYFQAALGIGNAINFSNPSRAPLLLVAGERDRTSTPSMVRAMFRKHSRSPARTSILEFAGRSHWLIAEPGCEEVAAAIGDWLAPLSR